jgi:hypothetical protein
MPVYRRVAGVWRLVVAAIGSILYPADTLFPSDTTYPEG